MDTLKVRPSPIAGLWYPGHPNTLRQQVCDLMDKAELPKLEGELIALIAPHAGYRYSGSTAGYAFSCVRGLQPEVVAVVSPFHEYHPMPLLTTAYQAYETPLGVIPVSQEDMQALNDYLGEEIGEDLEFIVQEREHAVEIELPFLQCALASDFKLIPVMVSTNDEALVFKLGEGLAHILKGRKSLLVASTDLSHFYKLSAAKRLDMEMLKQIESFSPEGVLAAQCEGSGQACGVMAVVAVMVAAKRLGANTARLLHYSNSGEKSGDYESVVGYGAVALLKC
jgi:AmmeMemoRadiSam system protein B